MSAVLRPMRRDPIWLREWRATARLARTPWLLSLSLLAMTLGLVTVGALGHFPYPSLRGQYLSQIYFGSGALLVVLLGPALAASAVAAEREGKTWEALVMTGLAPERIDRGKFRAAYSELALYLFMLLPAAGLPHVAGGVRIGETALGLVMLFALGALAVRFGLAVSAALPTARSALLVTVLASALLSLSMAAASAIAVHWLRHRVELPAVSIDAPVFWPVALAYGPWSLETIRYLLVIPGLLAATSWVFLRRLSFAGMSERRELRTREHARAFAGLVLPLAFTLGLVPFARADEAFALEIFLALVVFAELVTFAGAPHVGRAWALRGLGQATLAFVTIPAVARLVAFVRGAELASSDSLRAMTMYAPAFAAFLYSLDSLLRALRAPVAVARGVVVATALAGAVLPLLVSFAIGFTRDESPPSWPIAWSPLSVLNPEPVTWDAIHSGVATWVGAAALIAVGAALVRRRRR